MTADKPRSAPPPPALLFLHTAEAHRPRFRDLLAEEAPDLPFAEIVDTALLRDVMAAGRLTPALEGRLRAHLQAAKDRGAGAVLCTCSTLGGPAEALGRALGLATLRIDRGMAEAAVAAGNTILVLACIDSTLAPTCDLLRETAALAGRKVEIRAELVPDAWRHFLAGDGGRYLQAVAETVASRDGSVDVIVLAQASMAEAAGRFGPWRSTVLSSPRLGLRRALQSLA